MNRIMLAAAFAAVMAVRVLAQDATPAPPPSVPAELAVSGVAGLVSDKLKEVKGAVLVTLGGKPGAAGYLPIWTWHTVDGTPIMEFPTLGYRAVQGARPDAFTTVTFNLPGVSAQLFGGRWFKDHVTKTAFPPIFFGPALIVPLDLQTVKNLQWNDWRRYVAVVASVRLAAKPIASIK